jgi:hypothetical protein
LSSVLALGSSPPGISVADHEHICAAVRAVSPRVLGCEFSSGPDGESWLVVRFDRGGLAADYAAASAAAVAERVPVGENHRQAFLIQTTDVRAAISALSHDPNRSLSAVYIEDSAGPRVIRRETLEACGSNAASEPSRTPEVSESVLQCLMSVQPSVFTLVHGK